MALSGFGQRPANRGKALASHKAKPEAVIRPTGGIVGKYVVMWVSLYLVKCQEPGEYPGSWH